MRRLFCLLMILVCVILSAQNNTDHYTGQTEITTSSGCKYIVEEGINSFHVEKATNTLRHHITHDIITGKPIGFEDLPLAIFYPDVFYGIVKTVFSEKDYCFYNSLPKGNIVAIFRVDPQTERALEVAYDIFPRGDNEILSISPDLLERLEQAFISQMRFDGLKKNYSLQTCGRIIFDKIVDY